MPLPHTTPFITPIINFLHQRLVISLVVVWRRGVRRKQYMQPKYKLIIKEGDIFNTYPVETLTFLTNKGLPVVSASYYKGEEKTVAIIDESTCWLYQSTNAFDRYGKLIYHGDLLQDEQGILYEVMYAVGSYFIVKDDAPLMLLDEHVRRLTVAGNIIENYDLIKIDATPLEEVAQNI